MECQLFTAVTGNYISERELDTIGERVLILMRVIAVQEGRTCKEDKLNELYFRPLHGDKGLSLIDFERAKIEYYLERGWDENRGWPTKQKLNELGISDVLYRLPAGMNGY
jgi:aldehyde:ferredoxin oxidoreductase